MIHKLPQSSVGTAAQIAGSQVQHFQEPNKLLPGVAVVCLGLSQVDTRRVWPVFDLVFGLTRDFRGGGLTLQ